MTLGQIREELLTALMPIVVLLFFAACEAMIGAIPTFHADMTSRD
jgi:hypothetical protein